MVTRHDPDVLRCAEWTAQLLRHRPDLVAESVRAPYPDQFETWLAGRLYNEVNAATGGALHQLVDRDDPRWYLAAGMATRAAT